jgi:hypothetical protein
MPGLGRHARSAAPTRTPTAPHARATHRDTSSVSPSLEHLLPPGQRLAPEPPRFPGSFRWSNPPRSGATTSRSSRRASTGAPRCGCSLHNGTRPTTRMGSSTGGPEEIALRRRNCSTVRARRVDTRRYPAESRRRRGTPRRGSCRRGSGPCNRGSLRRMIAMALMGERWRARRIPRHEEAH